jgi:hypothetical protein
LAVASTSRRSTAGIAFIVAGVLLLVEIILNVAGVTATGPWLDVLAYLAIAVGLVILAIGSVASIVARIALIAGAIGYLVLALGTGGAPLPGALWTIALILAALGGLIGAIVLYTGKEITNRSAVAFIATTIVAAVLFLLLAASVVVDSAVFLVLIVLFGIGLVITGVLLNRVQRGS